MKENPDPLRMPEEMWIAWREIRAGLGPDVKLAIPRFEGARLGYHMTPAELPLGNYSIMRMVDKLGVQHKFSALDIRFKSAEQGDHSHIATITNRLLVAYDDRVDGRIGSHNVAEVSGTLDGLTVVGRIHGRYASGSDFLRFMIHVAVNRQWTTNLYVYRCVASVILGETHEDWLRREHPRHDH